MQKREWQNSDSFKASETLLGIETESKFKADERAKGFKASETLLGIETVMPMKNRVKDFLHELQSLWNPFRDWNVLRIERFHELPRGFKASETLLGIETSESQFRFICIWASKPLKPF